MPPRSNADRTSIAAAVRALRTGRGWTQAELAERLGLSQSRLSELERGAGSFTAEQFLELLRLFNVPASNFVRSKRDASTELQQALARFGAEGLYVSRDVLPSDERSELVHVLRDAIVAGSPRLVTAVAPVLLARSESVNLNRLQAQLADLGFERRLPWLVENTLSGLHRRYLDGVEMTNLRSHTTPLEVFLDYFGGVLASSRAGRPPDVLDSTIRSKKSVDEIRASSSEISRRWGIVTALQPEDFLTALEPVLVGV